MILIQYDGKNYLVDSGKHRADGKLITYLRDQNIDTLHSALMTQPDYDHYGELEDLIESEIIINRFIRNRDHKDNVSFNSLVTTLASSGIQIDTVDH